MILEINYIYISIILALVGGTFWFGQWVGGVNKGLLFLGKRIDDLANRMDDLANRVDGLVKRVDGLVNRMDGLTNRMDDFAKRVDGIQSDIKSIFHKLPSSPVSDNSPLQLNDLGDEISESLKAKDWASKTALSVAGRVKGKQPFEIQEFCVEYVNEEFKPTDEQDDQIRTEAYNHRLTKEQILQVLVVVLRNQLLE